MIETITALTLAHMLADFPLQSGWMVRRKRNIGVLLLHGAIVLMTAQAALGTVYAPELLILAGVHLVIDAGKTYSGVRGFWPYLADQAAHFAVIVAVAGYAPDLWSGGLWAGYDMVLPLMAVTAGLIATLQMGEYAIGFLMAPHALRIRNQGLKNGGRLIGTLERAMIFTLIGMGQPLGVGFLVAAKSILRFGTATRDQRTAEYVIIGTLASFLWALLASYATFAWVTLLPAIEITGALP